MSFVVLQLSILHFLTSQNLNGFLLLSLTLGLCEPFPRLFPAFRHLSFRHFGIFVIFFPPLHNTYVATWGFGLSTLKFEVSMFTIVSDWFCGKNRGHVKGIKAIYKALLRFLRKCDVTWL